MITLIGTAQSAALAAITFAAAAAVGSRAVYPALRSRLLATAPAERARSILAWLAAPSALAVVLTMLCFLPSALGVLGLGTDHCASHDDHHPHLCLVHRSPSPGGAAGWLTLVLVGGAGLVPLGRQFVELRRACRLLAGLAAGSTWDARRGVRVLETAEPLSVAAGIRSGDVFLSSGLTDSLPAETLEVVIEHERAHLRRRDALWRVVARALSIMHLPSLRATLLADFALACEQACDEEAAHGVDDRLRVASAIVRVERVLAAHRRSQMLLAPAFGGSDVEARVETLLADQPYPSLGGGARWPLFVIGGVVALAAAGSLHHFTETALSLLTR